MDELQKLYNAVSAKFDVGEYDSFRSKMDTPEKRRSFYDAVTKKGFDLGEYDVYESRLGKPLEVSDSGSAGTSTESVEPDQNTVLSVEQPTQPSGVISEQSSGLETPEVLSPDQIPTGFRDAGGGTLIPEVQVQGTWRESFKGDWAYDTQGYEVYVPTQEQVDQAGGWDVLSNFFRKEQPNTLLARPNQVDESGEVVGELTANFINEDTAKPVDLKALSLERELSNKPFEEWDEDDQLDYFVSRIATQNIKAGTAPQRDRRDVIVEEQAADRRDEDRGAVGVVSDAIGSIVRGFGRGSTRLLADALDIPEFLYDAIANVTSSPTFQERYGDAFVSGIQDYLRGAVSRDELYNSIRFGDEGVVESFMNGNIEDGVNKLVSATAESLPIMLTLSSGNASALASTLSMGAGQYDQLQENNPEMDTSMQLINATLNMYAEMIPEKIGADAVFKPFYDLYRTSGREVAEGAISGFLRKLGGRFGIMTPAATESLTEGATNVMQNLIAKYSGEDPNRKINDGFADAVVVGGFSGGAISSPAQVANSIASNRNKARIQGLVQENMDIEVSLNDRELPDDIRQRLVERYTNNTNEVNQAIEAEIEAKGRLSDSQQQEVSRLEASRERVNSLVGNESVPESVRANAQVEVDQINSEIEQIIQQDENTEIDSQVPVEDSEVAPVGETVEQSQELVEETPTQNEEEIAQETQTQEGLTPKENNNKSLSEDEYFTVPTSSTNYDGYIVIDKDTYDKWKEIDDNENELINQAKRGERLLGRERTAKKIKGIAMSSAAEKRKVLGIDNSDEVSRIDVSKVQVNDEYTSGDKTYKVTGFAFGQPMVSENGGTPKKLNTFNNESDIRKGLLNQKKAKRDDLIEKSKVNHYGRGVTREEAWNMAVNEYGKQNEEVVTETVDPVAETGPQDQNVDAQTDEIDMSLVPDRPDVPDQTTTGDRALTADAPEFATPDEQAQYVADNSSNPDEVAYVYSTIPEATPDGKDRAIMDYIGTGKLRESDIVQYGDSTWVSDATPAQKRRWIDSSNEGIPLDVAAQELSEDLGYEVTPEDMVNVVMSYGGTAEFNNSAKTPGQIALENRYKVLTGRNLTPTVARNAANRESRRIADLTDEQRAAVDEDLQELGITYQDIVDYEEFNRQISESGPGGLQQPEPIQGRVRESSTEGDGSQVQQTEVEQTEVADEAQTETTTQENEPEKVRETKKQKVAENSKVEAKRRESALADTPTKIREGVAVPTDLKGSRGSEISVDAFGVASDVVASAIEDGSNLEEATNKGVESLKKSYWYRTLPKESKNEAIQSFRDGISGANEMVYSEQNPSAKNSRSQKLREKYGFGDRIVPATKGSDAVLAEARADISEGRVFPIDVVNKGLRGAQLSAKEQAIVVEYMNQLEAEVALRNDRVENSDMTNEAFVEEDKLRDQALNNLSAAIYSLERTGTEIARALASRKWIVNRDVSLPSMLSMKRKANGNNALTSEQLNQVRREFDDIMRSKDRLDKRMAEVEAELARAKADIVIMAQSKQAELDFRRNKNKAGSRKEAVDDIQRRRSEAKQALKDAISKITNIGFAYNPKQQATNDAEFLKALGSLLRTYMDEALLRAGKVNHNSIINNITRDLREVHPNITKEQVALLIDSLDSDTRPTLSDLRTDIANLREEIKDHNLESEKKSIRNRIKTIQDRIKAKDFRTVPKNLDKYDAEYKKLKRDLDNKVYEFRVEVERDKLRRRGLLSRIYANAYEVFALPRALMATGDLSAPLRQGIVAMVGNFRTGRRAFAEMHKMALSESYYEDYHESIRDSDMYDLAVQSGLSLSGVGNNVWTTLREEQWTSKLMNRIPILKQIAGFSERGFAGFLNKMRFDLFNNAAEMLMNEGKNPQEHLDQFKAIATYVNAITGRGPVPSRWEGMFGDLSTALFAPRLITSRLYLLLGGPIVTAARSGNWDVARMYAKDMSLFVAFGLGTMFLASMFDGVEIEGDDDDEPVFTDGSADTWTKSDFMNIRVGDTRYDIWGGFAQYIRLFSRLLTGQTTTSSGKVKFSAEARNIGDTRLGWVLRFGQSKLSPTASFVTGALSHRNYMGDPFDPVNELQNMAWPLVFQETYESMFGTGDFRPESLATVFLPSAYGIGVQTWSSNSFLNNSDSEIAKILADKKLGTYSKRQQDVNVIDADTGQDRPITEEEFKQFKDVWDGYVNSELSRNKDRLKNMTPKNAEKEFNKIKSAATTIAKKSVTGVASEDTRIQFNNQTYNLNADNLKRRIRYMDEFKEQNGSRFNSEYRKYLKRQDSSMTDQELDIAVEKQMDSEARKYSRGRLLDDYVKGRIKLEQN